jgi:hypothetical protein
VRIPGLVVSCGEGYKLPRNLINILREKGLFTPPQVANFLLHLRWQTMTLQLLRGKN